MSKQLLTQWGFIPLWLLLTASLLFRQPIPIDETRYFTVAWEMWLRGDFLVPYLNGQTYSHKPPLLFWLMTSGWGLLGFNEWWPRLVGPLCALINLLLTRKIATKLWPEHTEVALLAPWILLATLLWTLFATSTMFDTLLTNWVLLGMLGLLEISTGSIGKGWIYLGLAIGLGILAKGPVIFLHLLPTAILVSLWFKPVSYRVWFAYLLLAILAGVAVALSWALPAANQGGAAYADAILWHQTADRTVGTKIHARAFYWYLPFLPLLLFPWISWPRLWQSWRATQLSADHGLRFCLIWFLSILVLFSLLPSKQLHYLIPMLPAFALLAARSLSLNLPSSSLKSELVLPLIMALIGLLLICLPVIPGLSKLNWVQNVEPFWGLSTTTIALILLSVTVYQRQLSVFAVSSAVITAIFIGFICFFQYTGLAYNLVPAAQQVAEFNQQHIPYAFVGNYQGQLHYLGRLTQPIPIIASEQAKEWVMQHPGGYLISLENKPAAATTYQQLHREDWLIFRNAQQVLQQFEP